MYAATEINNFASLTFRMHAQFIDSQHIHTHTHIHTMEYIETGKRTPNCNEYIHKRNPSILNFRMRLTNRKTLQVPWYHFFIVLYCYLLSRDGEIVLNKCLQCRTLTWNKLNWQLRNVDESSSHTRLYFFRIRTHLKMDTTKNCIHSSQQKLISPLRFRWKFATIFNTLVTIINTNFCMYAIWTGWYIL